MAAVLTPTGARKPHEHLTVRELQIMLRLADGKKAAEIARQLSLSAKTVDAYRSRLMEKMGLKSNSELTYYALKHGLIQ
jgi:DNA-binding NarL/FixJ family response regulator